MQALTKHELRSSFLAYSFRFRRVLLILFVVLWVTACNSGTLRLGQAAADDVYRAAGRTGSEVTMGQDDLSRLTAKYDVSEEAVKQVAPSAQVSPAWAVVKARTVDIFEAAHETGVASAAIGVGCDGLTGQIQTEEELVDSLSSALAGMHPNRAYAMYLATRDLQEELAQIALYGSEEDKASSLWLCYSLGVAY